MNPTGVILYGPPASGKDTITAALTRLAARYTPFRRLKIGAGKTDGYRIGTPEQLIRLRASRQVLYENLRYGNTYVIDVPHLTSIIDTGQVPVLHLGQIAGVTAVTRFPVAWTTVLLWCSRESTAQRAHARGSTDIDARLTVWDETLAGLRAADDVFSRRIDTDSTTPDTAAVMIHACTLSAAPAPTAATQRRLR
ncbi:guanylate kinase [Micromonospora globispora]|uniref:Guanylate kinase n=1 Tax=Micromonospora globispora TaxID=1450148 RepID=A0A317K4K1_9ACTN|nr:guanylate kinase [Micromonospora globispora]PWU47821.1 guanylate kinase [Micromonospora globispora]